MFLTFEVSLCNLLTVSGDNLILVTNWISSKERRDEGRSEKKKCKIAHKMKMTLVFLTNHRLIAQV